MWGLAAFRPALLAALVALLLAACSRRAALGPLPEEPAELLSSVNVADPRATVQLAGGFSRLEFGAWRWTTRRFRVVLKPPADAGARGAILELSFWLPPVILDPLGPVTLSATVNGLALSAERFAQPGAQAYRRDVPAAALAGDAVAVEFATDKWLPPSSDDDREFALLAQGAALLPK